MSYYVKVNLKAKAGREHYENPSKLPYSVGSSYKFISQPKIDILD